MISPLNVTSCPKYLNEYEGKKILTKAGMPVSKGHLVHGREVVNRAQDIGYPVALKMMSEKLLHKTEAGAVKLAINNATELAIAIEEIKSSVSTFDPNATRDLFLVEKMGTPPLAELVVGLQQDVQFGLILTLGSGGILVELLGDSKTLLLPTDASHIEVALKSLKVFSLLEGFRGQPKADMDTVSQSIADLCTYVQNAPEGYCEVEINPLFIYEKGVLAVDALVRR